MNGCTTFQKVKFCFSQQHGTFYTLHKVCTLFIGSIDQHNNVHWCKAVSITGFHKTFPKILFPASGFVLLIFSFFSFLLSLHTNGLSKIPFRSKPHQLTISGSQTSCKPFPHQSKIVISIHLCLYHLFWMTTLNNL